MRDLVLLLALEHVGNAAGFERSTNGPTDATVIVDRVPLERADILVARMTPLAARIGVGALVAGKVDAIVPGDDPTLLAPAIEAVEAGLSIVPSTVLQLARALPSFVARHHQILACLAAGVMQDAAIAPQLNVSLATVKRDVQHLLRVPKVGTRQELASYARSLGYAAPMQTWELSLASAFKV